MVMAEECHDSVTSHLLVELPRFLGTLRKVIDKCGTFVVDSAVFTEVFKFKSLVAGKHQEPWQELWQHPELLWGGPDSLLESVSLFSALCERLLLPESNTGSLHTAAIQAHLALFRGWLEHATPAQRAELTADRHTLVLESLARPILELLPALFTSYAVQQNSGGHAALPPKEPGWGLRELLEQAQRHERLVVQRDMLQAATDALWLANTVTQICPGFGGGGITDKLSEWGRALREAEGCAWWEYDSASLELPMLLAELAVTYFEGPALSSQQQSAELNGQEELLAFVVRSSLRYVRAELEKCLQGLPGEPRSLSRCRRLTSTETLSMWLVDCATEHEDVLELWLEVLALVDGLYEALARPCIAGVAAGEAHWDQLKILSQIQSALALMHHRLLTAVWQRNARAAQLLEAAALQCAAGAVRTLAAVCPLVCPEAGHPFVQTYLGIFVDSACLVIGYLNMLAGLEAPAFSSPAARQPGAPRLPGGMAVAAALDAVRLGEAVLRCVIGVGREALLKACCSEALRGSSPATLCDGALTMVNKWAVGELPAGSGSRQVLYLLQLARGQSGLDALLSLLATQRKLVQAVAQGLPLAVGEAQKQMEELHQSLWNSLKGVTQVALALASASASRLPKSSSSSSAGGTGSGVHISREKEAVVCLAVAAARDLMPATCSRATAIDIFKPGDSAMQAAFLGALGILLYCNRHKMQLAALWLGGGAPLDCHLHAQLSVQPSPKASADWAVKYLSIFVKYEELLPAVLHGGLLRHAVEAYSAWLQADDIQLAVGDDWEPLRTMEVRFQKLCEAAAKHPSLPGVGPSMVEWAQLRMERKYDFANRVPKTKWDRIGAKKELQQVWGLRARQLCPAMERAARAAVRAELAPAPLPAAGREGCAAAEAAAGAPGSGCSTPAPASGAPRPTAQPMPSCPVAFAIRDIAVSRAGCANVHCRNLSGASESELPRLLCRGCLSVRYCSDACGREDWPRHDSVCRLVRLMRLGLAHCAQGTGEG